MSGVLRWWRDRPLWAKSAMAISVPMLLLLLALGFSYRMQQDILAADADVRRVLAIQNQVQTLQTLLAESATGVRGYLLTGREDFLDPYESARAALPAVLDALSRGVRDAEARRLLENVEHLLARKLLSLEDLRANGRAMAAVDLQAHLIGSKGVLDELRNEIGALNARETDLVAEYAATARAAVTRSLWVDAVTSILVLASGVVAFFLLFSSVVRRVQRLANNAERLVSGAALDRMPSARDELGLLAERLQNASALLAARAADAQAANDAKSRFLSRTSHELRTPLNAILGFAQLLEQDLREPPQTLAVAQILGAGRHLLSLIDDVLDIARIESGELRLSNEALALHALLAESTALVEPLARARGIALHLPASQPDLAVLADRQRLRQILLNLLSNAVKYNRPGGRVELACREEDQQVWIEVRDTGSGIEPALLSRLFLPFERLAAESAGVEGTGLGLAVSRQLAREMGGDIEVHSTPGVGSMFAVRLQRTTTQPVALAHSDQAPASTQSASEARRRVLAIEDNASNLALLRALVARRPSWTLIETRNGETGLAAARAQPPDLILLDLHLPPPGGEAVLTALRADPRLRDTPVVVVSADALPQTVARLLAAGAADYLTKPLDVPRFLALLDRSVDERR